MGFEKSFIDRPIGVFDSGIGGLTVMSQVIPALPNESFIYCGDTGRLPYGDKSQEVIIRYSVENALFLLQKKVKLLIVACNTASAYALETLQEFFQIPIVGVIEAGAESAVQSTKNERIAILGTKGTIASRAYQKAIHRRNPNAYVLPVACPLLVPLVEENFIDHPATRLIVREYLKSIAHESIDTLLLGCTHYPLLKKILKQEVGDQVAIVDSAKSCVLHVLELLKQMGIQRTGLQEREHQYFVSDDPEKFRFLGHRFLGMEIPSVEKCELPSYQPQYRIK